MLYFVPWVVFLLAVALAVPVVSMLEKRKHAPPKPAKDESIDQDAVSAEDVDMGNSKGELGDESMQDFPEEDVQIDAPGGDDFSAFDEDFK